MLTEGNFESISATFILFEIFTLVNFENTVFLSHMIIISIIILDIVHRPVFYLKHNFSEPGFCLRNVMF
jgi:hypothetical protein